LDKKKVLECLKEARKNSKKRKFNQTVDLIINFKELDLKKNSIDSFFALPFDRKKEIKVCAIVGEELSKQAKELCDNVISGEELEKLKNNAKEVKKISKKYDVFLAQANLMGQIATIFGRILGPLGKMPNPKLGGVLMPNMDIKNVVAKFKKNIRIIVNKEAILKLAIGKEDMKDDEIMANVMSVYDNIVHNLPKGEHNVKSVLLKLTMGKVSKIGKKNGS